jgi:hypothetical protein
MTLKLEINDKHEVRHIIDDVEFGLVKFVSFEAAWQHAARYAKPGVLDSWFKLVKDCNVYAH